MQPPRDTPQKKPSALDWKQRRGTSISLGSIGQSALRPTTDTRSSLLGPKPAPARPAQPQAKSPTPSQTATTGPTKPAPLPASKPSGTGAPQVSRAFMSGSLVPPRPLTPRPSPQPEAPKPQASAPTPTARAAQPAPLPRPTPAAPEQRAMPAAPRAHGIAPVAEPKADPKPEPEVLAAAAVAAPAQAPATGAPIAAPRKPAKNVRQFNANMAADARGATAAKAPLFSRRNLIAGAALVGVAGISAAAWWYTTHQAAPASPNGIAGAAATPASLAPAQPAPAPETVADNSSVSTSAVTEAPSEAAAEVSSVIAERPAGPPTNFGALAPKGAVRPPAPARAGRVVLADLPDAPDLGASTGRAEAEPAPTAAAPAPPPVIRLPSSDETFSTNTPNPEPGG